MSFDYKFLVTVLTENNISYQIVLLNKNSKLSVLRVTKQLASPFVLRFSFSFVNCNKASLISRAWNFIALTLSIQFPNVFVSEKIDNR